jgi:hypothetical protein
MIGQRILATLALCALSATSRSLAAPAPSEALAPSAISTAPTATVEAPVGSLLGDVSAGKLLDQVLQASGIDDPERREDYRRTFETKLVELGRHLGRNRSPYHRARRLHDALHETLLTRYAATADGIDAILDRGDYNCVSATLLYGIAARAFGLNMRVVETPRHIFLRLEVDGREVDIESTSPTGFDFTGDLERFRRYTTAFRYAATDEMERRGPYERFERFDGVAEPVSLERATGFLWHNTAERALARGDAVRAAESFLSEYRSNPELATRLDGFSTSLARAFRIEYEDGQFDNAYRIAEMELMIFPARTTTRDRLLAAASKRIDSACEAGDPEQAEGVLDAAGAVLRIPSDLSRLEREICPHIAAAAVLGGDWARAERMASRYVSAEPDPVEGARFQAWVESRKSDGGASCLETVPGSPRQGPSAGVRP